MLLHKALRYRPEPTPEQDNLLTHAAGCARFVWNRALSLQKSYLEQGCRFLSYMEMARCLTTWRNGEAFGFLSEPPIHPQQGALKFLDRALKDAFDNKEPQAISGVQEKGPARQLEVANARGGKLVGAPGARTVAELEGENKQLRKELAQLRIKYRKKAAAYFARESENASRVPLSTLWAEDHADVNATKNILAREFGAEASTTAGHAGVACFAA